MIFRFSIRSMLQVTKAASRFRYRKTSIVNTSQGAIAETMGFRMIYQNKFK